MTLELASPSTPAAAVAAASDPFEQHLDRSFDPTFDALKLHWLPWVGRAFVGSTSRTIVLGESIYRLRQDAGDAQRDQSQDRTALRRRHVALGINGKKNHVYVRNFERAVTMSRTPTLQARAALWSQVIYHNLVPRLLDKRSHRPTVEDFTQGWREFLELAKATGATRCVVYGTDWRKVDALWQLLEPGQRLHKKRFPIIGRSRPSALSIQLGDRQLDMLFIGHPSNRFSWKEWGAFMRAQGMTFATQETPLPKVQVLHTESHD